MEITITIPEVLATQAGAIGLPPEAYVERLLGKIASASLARSRDREDLSSELLADWEHYRSTGLHLDGDEVDAWLAQLEAGENVEPPALHV
jgi:predicted transcriptional regulator